MIHTLLAEDSVSAVHDERMCSARPAQTFLAAYEGDRHLCQYPRATEYINMDPAGLFCRSENERVVFEHCYGEWLELLVSSDAEHHAHGSYTDQGLRLTSTTSLPSTCHSCYTSEANG